MSGKTQPGEKRSAGKDQVSYAELDKKTIENYHLIINTTPLGTFPNIKNCPPIPYEHLSSSHFLFDLIYNPEQTLFLKKGLENGAKVQNGYNMLVYHAEKAWELWNH